MDGFAEDGSLHLIDYMNTYNPALRVIAGKGYKLFLYPDDRDGFLGKFWAIKNNRNFVADDPLRLLGLISVWETYGDRWNGHKDKTPYDNRNLHDEIVTRAFPENAEEIENLSESEFNNYVSDYRIFFSAFTSKEIIPDNVTREAFFDIVDNFYKWDPKVFYEWEK